MERIGRAKRDGQAEEEEVFGATVNVTGQLDALIRPILEAAADRVSYAAHARLRDGALAQTARQRGDELRHGEI